MINDVRVCVYFCLHVFTKSLFAFSLFWSVWIWPSLLVCMWPCKCVVYPLQPLLSVVVCIDPTLHSADRYTECHSHLQGPQQYRPPFSKKPSWRPSVLFVAVHSQQEPLCNFLLLSVMTRAVTKLGFQSSTSIHLEILAADSTIRISLWTIISTEWRHK